MQSTSRRPASTSVAIIQAIEAESPVDPIAFAAGKAVLVSNVLFGMTIRRYNQLIAPAGNAALPGLAKVGSCLAGVSVD